MRATAKDLRSQSRKLLDIVSRGEEVVITYRGKPCARLVPYQEDKNITKSELFGIWKDRKDIQDVEEYARHLRKGRILRDY